MSKEYDLGRVVGRDATINGQNAIQLIAGGNIKIEQDGENVTISLDEDIKQWICNNFSNPNLLINGDFKINQRSSTKYVLSNNIGTYTFDRWRARGVGNIVEIDGSGVRLTKNNPDSYLEFLQETEIFEELEGKVLTASCLLDGIFYSVITPEGWTFPVDGKMHLSRKYHQGGAVEISIIVTENKTLIFYIYIGGSLPVGTTVKIEDVKLEIGETATPFIPRGIAEELSLCQRYCLVLKDYNSSYSSYGIGASLPNGNLRAYISLPVPLRTAPTVTLTGGKIFDFSTFGYPADVESISTLGITANTLEVEIIPDNSLTVGKYYLLTGHSPNKTGMLLVDAEIY